MGWVGAYQPLGPSSVGGGLLGESDEAENGETATFWGRSPLLMPPLASPSPVRARAWENGDSCRFHHWGRPGGARVPSPHGAGSAVTQSLHAAL